FSAALAALAFVPALRTARETERAWRPTTRLLARDWLLANLPAGATVVVERGSAPLWLRQQMLDERLDAEPLRLRHRAELARGEVDALLVPSLPSSRERLDDYTRAGYRYAVTMNLVPGPGLGERGLSAAEMAFYEDLTARARPLARFDAEPTRAGPAIIVW